MKVTISGGAGYLGTLVVETMLKRGHEVTIIDNFLYNKHSLDAFRDKITVVEGDIRDMRPVSAALKDADAVIHLAAIVGDQACDLDAKATMQINQLATKMMVDMCNLYEVPKFLYASTCSVYGERPDGVMDEETPVKPISLYGITKAQTEEPIRKLFSREATIFRLGTLFGLSHRQRFDLAINLFIAKGATGEKLTVFGGKQWRPFLHVRDAAECFTTAAENEVRGVYNLSWENLRILDVAHQVGEHFGVEVEVTPGVVDARDYKVDTSKMRAAGLTPSRTVETAIGELEAAFKRNAFGDWKQNIYSDYKHLFSDFEAQKKIYTMGPQAGVAPSAAP